MADADARASRRARRQRTAGTRSARNGRRGSPGARAPVRPSRRRFAPPAGSLPSCRPVPMDSTRPPDTRRSAARAARVRSGCRRSLRESRHVMTISPAATRTRLRSAKASSSSSPSTFAPLCASCLRQWRASSERGSTAAPRWKRRHSCWVAPSGLASSDSTALMRPADSGCTAATSRATRFAKSGLSRGRST